MDGSRITMKKLYRDYEAEKAYETRKPDKQKWFPGTEVCEKFRNK